MKKTSLFGPDSGFTPLKGIILGLGCTLAGFLLLGWGLYALQAGQITSRGVIYLQTADPAAYWRLVGMLLFGGGLNLAGGQAFLWRNLPKLRR